MRNLLLLFSLFEDSAARLGLLLLPSLRSIVLGCVIQIVLVVEMDGFADGVGEAVLRRTGLDFVLRLRPLQYLRSPVGAIWCALMYFERILINLLDHSGEVVPAAHGVSTLN